MTSYAEQYRTSFEEVLQRRGTAISVIYGGGSYAPADDYDILLRSGESVQNVLGMIQPVGNSESDYLVQGKLLQSDKKVYIHGSVTVDSAATFIIPTNGSYYDVLGEGIQNWDLSGVTIYKKVFIRASATGSRAVDGSDTIW